MGGWNDMIQYTQIGSGEESISAVGATSKDSSSNLRGEVPVYLNVYDLTPLNGYSYWFGVGIFHSGVEAHGVEYGFGAHDFPTTGVFEVEPRSCPGFVYRKTVLVGTTGLGPYEFREFIEQLASNYSGDSYHLLLKNCNHFSNDVSLKLTGHPIPSWVNRLAKLGLVCNCLLPEYLQATPGSSNTLEKTCYYEEVHQDKEEDQAQEVLT